MKSLSFPRSFSLILLVGALSFVSGCSANLNMPDTQGTSDFGNLQGGVYGGHAPITAAQVYIFETPSSAGTGYGDTLPVSLIGHPGSSVTCNASVAFPIIYNATSGICSYQTGGYNGGSPPTNNLPAGQFNLSGIYKCDIGQNVWLYAVGGYPDQGTGDFNPYLTLMAALGPCPTVVGDPTGTGDFSGDTFIYMNELSTVAMAYAVSPFTGDTSVVANTGINTKISAPVSNSMGLQNAFNNAGQLYDISGKYDDYSQTQRSAPTKTPYGTHNGIPPNVLINTLGNALAACVDSIGNLTAISPNCNALFADVYNQSTPPDTDTASAALYIAQNPSGTNTGNLTNLATMSTAWAPALASGTFHDLTASIAYKLGANGVTSTPTYGVVTDQSGNAFLNYYSGTGYLIEMSPLGAPTTSKALPTAIDRGVTIAIDSAGYIWSPSSTTSLFETANTSTFTSTTNEGSVLTSGKIDPIAVDKYGYVYVADPTLNGGEIYKTNAANTTTTITTSSSNLGNGCVKAATDVAVDSTGNLWVTGTGAAKVCRIANDGSSISTYTTAASGISNANYVAVDSSNAAWVIDKTNQNLHKITTGGTVSGPYGGGGISGTPSKGPVGMTIDGAGNIWTINNNTTTGSGSISEFSNNGAGISDSNYGFQYGNLTTPEGISIDISGDVWVANYGASNVLEVIGAAAPTNAYYLMEPGTLP